MKFSEEYKKSAENINPDRQTIDRMKAAVLKELQEHPDAPVQPLEEPKKPLPLRRIAYIGGAVAACAAITIAAVNLVPSLKASNGMISSGAIADSSVAAAEIAGNETAAPEFSMIQNAATSGSAEDIAEEAAADEAPADDAYSFDNGIAGTDGFISNDNRYENENPGAGDAPIPEQSAEAVPAEGAVYEAHFYTPAVFTHQSAGDSVEYPKPCYVDNYLEYWVGCMSARQTSQDTYYESGFFTAGEDYNIYAPVLHSLKLGSGTALFDDVTVTEYAPDGTSGVVWHNDFSDGSQKPENVWSSDGTGSWAMSAGYLKISGGTDDYVLTFDKLKLREGCKYKISGHMRTVGAPSGGFADIRADFSLAQNVYESGREYVFAELSDIVRFGKENNVPIYIGEFGADAESFKNGLGGERWVADVMDFCNENGISYSYHAYHEPMFGFYPEDTGKYPQRRNEALAKVFADKNRNG